MQLRLTGMSALAGMVLLFATSFAVAHNLSESNARYVESLSGTAIIPFLYLGAKHMVTGYDHLLYLVGVVFFLATPRHVLIYVTLFAVGHSITLLLGVLMDLAVNAYLIDAIIGLSIVYKALENLGGLKRLGIDPRAAVFVFGLCHGLGLATKLQQIALSGDGLIANLVSFNLGVEVGQILALSFILLLLLRFRQSSAFTRHQFTANTLLMAAGFVITGHQLTGYYQ